MGFFKKFTTKELIFIALMGALLLVMNFAIGGVVIAASGIPGSSGLVTGITNAVLIGFVALVVRKFGAITILYIIYALLTLPTPMGGGPAGFVPKVVVVILGALIADIVISAFKFKKWSFFLALLIAYPVMNYATWKVLEYFNMPGAEKLGEVIVMITIIFMALAVVGLFIGFFIYVKLKDKHFIKQLRNAKDLL